MRRPSTPRRTPRLVKESSGDGFTSAHIALWLNSGDDHLRSSTRAPIDGCWQNGGTIQLSAVSVWEIALLVDCRRIELDLPIEAWITRFLQRPGIEPAPLGHSAGSKSCRLYQLEHRDPADRLLIRHRDRTRLSAGYR